ncbi:uncharacterized protein LAESUDRAFT_611005, partial [Laetiporus sulphureus 93-53]
PTELCDRIIDFLDDDRMALRTCALTCRAWLSSAQYHIFSHVLLGEAQILQAFHSLLLISPHLGIYVRCLDIVAPIKSTPATRLRGVWLAIFQHLGSVRKLTVKGFLPHM